MSAPMPKCPKCGRPLTVTEYSPKLLYCSTRAGRAKHGDASFFRAATNGRLKPAKEPSFPSFDLTSGRMTDTVADRWTPDMARSSILGRGRE